jgi:molybdopterin-guanine dinucleotide biosynthesis protein A
LIGTALLKGRAAGGNGAVLDAYKFRSAVSGGTAMILAGGKSSRMGVNKALLGLNGKTFIEIMLDKVSGFGEILLVVNDPAPYARLTERGVRIVRDIMPGQGPVSGVHAGLSAAAGDFALALACDMPLLPAEFAEYLYALAAGGGSDITAPLIGGRYQPLCAVYRKTCVAVMESNLKAGQNKITGLFHDAGLRARGVEETEMAAFGDVQDFFININDRRAYEELRARGNGSTKNPDIEKEIARGDA